MQADVFEILKSVLRARRITYAEMARRLDLSEPTIKRIFAEKDCKLSRITEICDVLDLSLADVTAQASRIEVRPIELGDRVEAQLAEDRPAFHLFLLLRDGMSADAIMTHYQLDHSAMFALARRLERTGLIELMPMGRIRLLEDRPIRFRRDGPLHRTLIKLNMDFIKETYLRVDTDMSGFLTQSRRISETTARHVMDRLNDLNKELSDLARKDQLTLPVDALRTYKLVLAWSPVSFSTLLNLDRS